MSCTGRARWFFLTTSHLDAECYKAKYECTQGQSRPRPGRAFDSQLLASRDGDDDTSLTRWRSVSYSCASSYASAIDNISAIRAPRRILNASPGQMPHALPPTRHQPGSPIHPPSIFPQFCALSVSQSDIGPPARPSSLWLRTIGRSPKGGVCQIGCAVLPLAFSFLLGDFP